MAIQAFLRQHWDRAAGWGSILVGAIVLLLGWLGVSDTVYPAEQIPYVLSGGVFGLFLCAVGAALLLSADLRDEWHKLDSIEEAIREGAVDNLAGSIGSTAHRADVTAGNGAIAPRRSPTAGRRRGEPIRPERA
jgi:hypothetical protein